MAWNLFASMVSGFQDLYDSYRKQINDIQLDTIL